MKQLIGYVEYHLFSSKYTRFIFECEGSYIVLGIHGKYANVVASLEDVPNIFVGHVQSKVIKF